MLMIMSAAMTGGGLRLMELDPVTGAIAVAFGVVLLLLALAEQDMDEKLKRKL
jgi:hypothetical protein